MTTSKPRQLTRSEKLRVAAFGLIANGPFAGLMMTQENLERVAEHVDITAAKEHQGLANATPDKAMVNKGPSAELRMLTHRKNEAVELVKKADEARDNMDEAKRALDSRYDAGTRLRPAPGAGGAEETPSERAPQTLLRQAPTSVRGLTDGENRNREARIAQTYPARSRRGQR